MIGRDRIEKELKEKLKTNFYWNLCQNKIPNKSKTGSQERKGRRKA